MKKYYCDVCGKEFNQDDLDENYKHFNKVNDLDVCKQCADWHINKS